MKKIYIPLKKCEICNKLFSHTEKRISIKVFLKVRFCSLKCRGKWRKKNFTGKNNPNWKGGISNCENCKRKLAARYGKRGVRYCKRCWFYFRRNENHHNWQGGITKLRKNNRNRRKLRIWKREVLKQGNYKCLWCKRKKDLEIDHIKLYSLFPKLRYKLSNGRILCKNCHKKTNTWGAKLIKYKKSVFL